MAFAPASVLSDEGAPASPLTDDLFAIPDAVLPATMYAPVRHRRRSLRVTTLVLLALLLFGVAAFVVNRAGTGGTPRTGQAIAPPTTTAPPLAPDNQFSFVAMTNLVTRFYGLLPGDVDDAYQLLGQQYQAKFDFNQFTGFYGTIAQVNASDFRQVGPNKITAVINFVTRHGAVTHEPYVFTLVPQNGTLTIGDAVQANHANVKIMSG
jgi:hypothetical protein